MGTSRLNYPLPGAPAVQAPPPAAFSLAEANSLAQISDPVRRLGFYTGVGFMFLRYSMLNVLLVVWTHTPLYIIYPFAIPTVLAVLLTGAVMRTFEQRAAIYVTGYACLMALAVPFSAWPGGSLSTVLGFWRTDFLTLFICGGLLMLWSEARAMASAIAWSGAFNVLIAHGYRNQGDRLSLWQGGAVSNSNDLAAHLLLVLPFLFWRASSSKSNVVRLVGYALVADGVYLILQTGSRGAVVALLAGFLFFLWRATPTQRLAAMIIVPIAAAGILLVLPKSTFIRLKALTSSDAAQLTDAAQSSMARDYLLRKSIELTLSHPIFGVGPGQFATVEGSLARAAGGRGNWHQTHNTFTQASAESGIPAALFYIASLISTFLLLGRSYKLVKDRPDCADIAHLINYAQLGFVTYNVAVTFLNFAYTFYIPAFAGLAIAIYRASSREVQSRKPLPPAPLPPWMVRTPGRATG